MSTLTSPSPPDVGMPASSNEVPLLLVVNDDGIHAPGIAAACAALTGAGRVVAVAPASEQSGMGRALPHGPDQGRICQVADIAPGVESWSVVGSPAQAVDHALLELLPRRPDLVVSGINAGANVGIDVTLSGTVMAAMQAACHGLPAVAVSMQLSAAQRAAGPTVADFAAAAAMLFRLARRVLTGGMPAGAAVGNLNVAAGAACGDQPRVVVQADHVYGRLLPVGMRDLAVPHRIGWEVADLSAVDADTDLGCLRDGCSSLTWFGRTFTAPGS